MVFLSNSPMGLFFPMVNISAGMNKFVTPTFRDRLDSQVMNRIFPLLGPNERTFLLNNLIVIIDYMALWFNFDIHQRNLYERKLEQNNFRDCENLLNIILPFIDDPTYVKRHQLTSLSQIYTQKQKDVDINKESPHYVYSNLQYGRCTITDGKAQEIQYNETHITQNISLLKDTIRLAANKLYVNWLHILPHNMDTIKESLFYKKTLAAITGRGLKLNRKQEDDVGYSGIPIDDIYDTISNFLYGDIKRIKFLIYDPIEGKRDQILLQMITNVLPLDTIMQDMEWNMLTNDDKKKFTEQWKALIRNAQQNQSMNDVESGNVILILRAIMIFFEMHSRNLNQAIKNKYTPIKFNRERVEQNDEDIVFGTATRSVITNAQVLQSAQSIKPIYIYEYLYQSLIRFIATWYGKLVVDTETKKLRDNFAVLNLGKRVTIKNIYNYAKALVHYTVETKYLEYPSRWCMLTETQRNVVAARLNIVGDKSWFNITGYLRKIRGVSENLVRMENEQIHNSIHGNLTDILCSVLTSYGLISQFVPNYELTEEKHHVDFKTRLQQSTFSDKNMEIWRQSFYFLTDRHYTDAFLESIPEYEWPTMYALDWISQISFYHRYIHNRVAYVTGGTGVGKSTQIPKLYLYGLKMLDYKTRGKVICSQPRVAPTIDNATRIAVEMGVPIIETNQSLGTEIKTANYYVQYSHKEGKHAKSGEHLILQIVTDGYLLKLLQSPLLKDEVYEGDIGVLLPSNMYDIVIVDESHEHNVNMDIILTKMRYALYYNNDLRLSMISATMDVDEPIYRRYYRSINDNLKYPLDTVIQTRELDRINVDRRVHISVPGRLTRNKIDEFYMPNADLMDILKEIFRTSTKGDILLFQPGTREIKKMLTNINANSPPNVIALPFYREMSNEKKIIIQNISDKISKIVIPKTVNFDDNYDEASLSLVQPGTYDRVVIVGTNIAEASITIPTLKYVIDDGNQKTATFDSITRETILTQSGISEESRLQRKGRVGRTSDGFAYFLYEKGSMMTNIKAYGISTSNLTDVFYDLLQDSPTESPYINVFPTTMANVREFSNGLNRFFERQWTIEGKIYNYIGSMVEMQPPPAFYQTGYRKETIEDRDGKFYIIHPEEMCIVRNIVGTIIKSKCDNVTVKNGKIDSMKLQTFWHILQERGFLTADYTKTELGKRMYALRDRMDIYDMETIMCYLYSRQYKSHQLVGRLLPMVELLLGNNYNLAITKIQDGRPLSQFSAFKTKFQSRFGDLEGLIRLIDHLFLVLQRVGFQVEPKTLETTDFSDLEHYKMEFLRGYRSRNYSAFQDKQKLLEKFISMYNRNKLTVSSGLSDDEKRELFVENVNTDYAIAQLDTINRLTQVCKKVGVDPNVIRQYFRNYIRFQKRLSDAINNIHELDERIKTTVNINWFDQNLPLRIPLNKVNHQYTQMLAPFIQAYTHNTFKRIDGTFHYVDVNVPMLETIYEIPPIYPTSPDKLTLLQENYCGDFVFCLGRKDGKIILINNIPSCLLIIETANPELLDSHRQSQMISQFIQSLNPHKLDTKYEKGDYSKIKIAHNYLRAIDEIHKHNRERRFISPIHMDWKIPQSGGAYDFAYYVYHHIDK